MELSKTTTYYVTSKGSVKGARGFVLPGEVFDTSHLTEAQLVTYLDAGTIGVDQSQSYTAPDIRQKVLPMNEAGTDDATIAPATALRDDGSARRALSEARRNNTAEPVEVLGAGPKRVERSEPIRPVETEALLDDRQAQLRLLAGKHLSPADARKL